MNRAQLKRHAIKVSYGKQHRTTSLFRAGRFRLYQWGSAIRAVIALQGPPANPASTTAYSLTGRTAFDDIFRDLINEDQFCKASEVDEWLQPLRESSPATFSAAAIRYVQRSMDGGVLTSDEQVRRFHKWTGLGRRTYYTRLDHALQWVCAEILEAEKNL